MADDPIAAMLADLEAQDVQYVRFEITDLHGTSRLKLIPIESVAQFARKGLSMYGGLLGTDAGTRVVPGTGLHEEVNYADQFLIPDPATLRIVPWLDHTARVICDCERPRGSPLAASPRGVLKGLLARADALGFDVVMAHEYEFYLLDAETRQPIFDGLHIFNPVRNQYVPFIDDLLDDLRAIGIDVITHNAEYGPGQFEINYGPSAGIAAADKAFTFKNAVKELAHRNGYLATFMSKPASDMSGSGCHIHVSLRDKASGKNLFQDASAADAMPDLFRFFIQGILDHAPALTALCCPTVNCYRRLRPHSFAPSNISWGHDDRSALVRTKGLGDDDARLEMRVASGLSSPYLSAAATLAAGLLGISEQRPLLPGVPGPSEDDPSFAPLPPRLEDALDALNADRAMVDLLGADLVHVFTTVKRYELDRFNDEVTEWERREYMEIY